MATNNSTNRKILRDALRNVTKTTKRRRSSLKKSLFNNKHKVDCAIDLDELDDDRSKYDEHVIALINKPPGPVSGITKRYKFSKSPPTPDPSPTPTPTPSPEEEKKNPVKPEPNKPPRKPKRKQPGKTTKPKTEDKAVGTEDLKSKTETETEDSDEEPATEDKGVGTEHRAFTRTKLDIVTYIPNPPDYSHLKITTPQLVDFVHRILPQLVQTPIEIVSYIPDPHKFDWTPLDIVDIPGKMVVPKETMEAGNSPIASPNTTSTETQDFEDDSGVTPPPEQPQKGSELSIILVNIEKLMQLCMTVHSKCPNDNSQVLAFIGEVHQDLIGRLNALKKEKEEMENEEKVCLCTWLRIHISTSEQDSYMYTINPRCPRCTLCQQGRQLLKAAGLQSGNFKGLWLALGTLLLCLESDDDDLFRQILEHEISDEMVAKVIESHLTLPGLPNTMEPTAVTTSSGNQTLLTLPGNRSIISKPDLADVFRLLVYMGTLWEARRCVNLLYRWLNVPAHKIKEMKEEQAKHLNLQDPISGKVSNINIINNNVFPEKGIDKSKQEITCIFVAVRKGNVSAFKILLDGPLNALFPPKARAVDLKRDTEPVAEDETAKGPTVFELLINQCYVSYTNKGKEDDCLLEMMDYVYQPNAIRKWNRQEEAAKGGDERGKHDRRTRGALADLILGPPGDSKGNMLKYAAEHGTSGVVERLMGNPPYRCKDRDDNAMGTACYLADGLEDTLKQLNTRAKGEVIGPILEVEPLKTIINDKWMFYRRHYMLFLVFYMVFMTIFTICAMFRPIGSESVSSMYQTTGDSFRLIGEIMVIIGMWVLFYTTIQETRVLNGVPKPWQRYDLYVIVNMLFFALIFITIVLRLALNENEDIILALALLCGWSNIIPRLAAFKRTGMFAIIMHHCIMKDFIPGFVWVFLIMLLGFSTATYTVYQTAPEEIPDFPNSTYWTTPFSLFKLTFGLLETDYATETRWSGIGVVLFLLYLYLMNVVLFNLLISMLGTTYQRIYDVVNEYWIQIRLSYVLLVEKWWPPLKMKYEDHDGCCNLTCCCLISCCPKKTAKYSTDGDYRYINIPSVTTVNDNNDVYLM